jgi:radical SAM superfamily enzyme YgiQ (UPF0313 family)
VIDGLGEGIGTLSPYRAGLHLHGLPFAEIVRRIRPDTEVISFSVMFSNYWPLTKDLVLETRAAFPEATLIAGGEHVSACPELVVTDSSIDFAVMGEGEETLVGLLDWMRSGRSPEDLGSVNGICYRDAAGAAVRNAPRKRVRKPDELPWPAWDLFPVEKYMNAELFNGMSFGRRSMVMLGTRGCPYTCKFCSNEGMWGTNYFVRSPKDIVDEMEFYVEKYGATDFQFQDLTFVVNARFVKQFCREILGRKLDVHWKLTSGTRSEQIDAEILELMSQSGCKEIFLAPESGSQRIGKISRKRVDLEKILSVGRIGRDHRIDMQISAFMIIGFPEEKLDDVFKTWVFLSKLALAGFSTAFINRFTAYPGSEYHDIALREGRTAYSDDYFLGLERNFSILNAGTSWHPRWSGRFIFLLMLIGYVVFFSTYYLRKPLGIVRSIAAVLKNEPKTRLERYIAYRIWQPLGKATAASELARAKPGT